MVLEGAKAVEHLALQVPIAELASKIRSLPAGTPHLIESVPADLLPANGFTHYYLTTDPNTVKIFVRRGLDAGQKDAIRLAYNAACRVAGQATTIGWGQKQAVTEMVAGAMKTRYADELKAHAKATRKEWPWIKRVMACCRPRHRRYDGEGMLSATVQGASDLKAQSVLDTGARGSVQIRGDGRHRVVVLRLRDGLSLEVPIVYHRPLPTVTT